MAARYVDTANIVAQGQSFYTGLLPGSYEKGAGGGGSNVMGKGSGGSAGVSADRTGSTAAQQSITGYPKGGSILGKEKDDSQTININLGGEDGGLQMPDPEWAGGEQGKPPPKWTPSSRGDVIDVDSEEIGPGSTRPALGPGGTGQLALPPGGPHSAADSLMPQSERVKWAAAGLPNPPNRPGQQKGWWEVEADKPAPFGHDKGLPWGTNQAPKTDPGPMGTGQKPQHGSVQGLASTRSHTRQPGVQQSIPQQAIPSLSVSGAASTRSHTRQSGVQQSATQQSIPFPNMPNSTNRALNF